MRRSLGMKCDSEDEQHMGAQQVAETLHELTAYEIKSDLLMKWPREFDDD